MRYIFVYFALMFSLACSKQPPQIDPNLPHVAIITTGGTIAQKYDPSTKAVVPAVSGEQLIDAVPQLKKLANIQVINFSNIDSSQMTPEMWLKLSEVVDKVLEDSKIVGAVITHGTDTMAEGSFFLDLTLKSNKPVVFTGAMKSASDPYPDGPPNLIDAVVQVCSKNAQNWGVTITMNSYINSARTVVKTQTTNPQTFESKEQGYLGYIHDKKVYRFNDRLYRVKLPRPAKLPKVVIIYDFPGADGSLLRYAVDQKVEGIVVEGMGSGNVNKPMFDAIKYALSKNIPVVITTDVYYGRIFADYGDTGGGESLITSGAVLSGDLRASKARLLLMLAMPVVQGKWKDLTKFYNLL